MAKIASQLAKVTFDLAGKARPNKPDAALLDAIQGAVTKALGPGYSISVYSGKENSGSQHGSNRHKTGLAADVHIIGPDGKTLNASKNKQQMLDVAKAFKELGGLGIGLGTDYMAGKGIHLDMFEPGVGQDTAWGNIGNAFQSWLDSFYRSPIQAALPSTMEANFPTREQGLLGTLTPEQMGIVPGALTPAQQSLANAHIAYGNSRAANMQPAPRGGYTPPGPPALGMGGYTPLGAPALGMGGYTPPAPARAYGGPANRPMPSGPISVPAAPSALGRSLATRAKDDRVSITGAAPSAMGRTGAQMSPNSADRTKDDNARSVSKAAPSALGSTIGRGGYSPPGSGFKAENVDRGLLGADPASSFRADNIDRSLTGANPRASDVVSGPNAPSWAGRPGVAGSMPAAPSGKLSPSVAGALAQRAGLEAIKDEDLSQVLAKTTVTHPPNPTVGLPPAVVAPPAAVIAPALVPRPPVQPRPVVVAPAPQAMPSRPVAPALRPSDIYGGTIGSALDNTGKNTVSRDAFGNTTVTNQYGATTGMTPGGYQTAYGSMGGIKGPSKATMGKIGGALKGGALGLGIAGPVGGLIGAALGATAAGKTSPSTGGGLLGGLFGGLFGGPSTASKGLGGTGSGSSSGSSSGSRGGSSGGVAGRGGNPNSKSQHLS